jgi:REP element-mobilizing transposase RayT
MFDRQPRKATRLAGYDYSQNGAYFVTTCTTNREMLFGEIADGVMRLNHMGEIVLACWNDLINHYAQAEYDAFVVMPNHIHAIVVLFDEGQTNSQIEREGHRPSPTEKRLQF